MARKRPLKRKCSSPKEEEDKGKTEEASVERVEVLSCCLIYVYCYIFILNITINNIIIILVTILYYIPIYYFNIAGF